MPFPRPPLLESFRGASGAIASLDLGTPENSPGQQQLGRQRAANGQRRGHPRQRSAPAGHQSLTPLRRPPERARLGRHRRHRARHPRGGHRPQRTRRLGPHHRRDRLRRCVRGGAESGEPEPGKVAGPVVPVARRDGHDRGPRRDAAAGRAEVQPPRPHLLRGRVRTTGHTRCDPRCRSRARRSTLGRAPPEPGDADAHLPRVPRVQRYYRRPPRT